MPEELDPQRFHIFGAKSKKLFLVLALICVFVLMPAFAFIYYGIAISRPSQTDKEITFRIGKGDSVSELAKNLYAVKVINSENLFILYIKVNKLDTSIQAGTYTIPAGISMIDLVGMFRNGFDDIQVTFIEGWRVEEFAREASRKFEKVDYRKFVEKATPLEGQLFPDTYLFNSDVTEDQVISSLNKTFELKTAELLTEKNLNRIGLTKIQALTLASIVERESRNPDERPIIAGILLKRYKEGIRLDADATTQYARAYPKLCRAETTFCTPSIEELMKYNWWDSTIYQVDLDFESSYNTRKVLGLPPGPISSFSLSSLDAVVNYEVTDYYFYLNDNAGNTYFAKTLSEHEANVAKYLSM